MEKKAINFSLNRFITKFRRSHSEHLDPNTLWRVILWATLIALLLIGIFAYITHDWALSVEAPATSVHSTRDPFSLAELEDVIALYHQKEVNYSALLLTAPTAPEYQRSKGTVATTTPGMQIDEVIDVNGAPTRTQ